MRISELLGIDPLPCQENTKKILPLFGIFSILSPFLFYLLKILMYTLNPSGYGLIFSIMTGNVMAGFLGIVFAFVSLVRNEKSFILFMTGLFLNVLIFMTSGNYVAEILKLYRIL